MIFTTTLLVTAFILCAAICGLIGSKRGILRQSIRAVMMLLSFVCAIYFAKLCTDAVMVWMDHKDASDLLAIIDRYSIPVLPQIKDLISYIDPSTLNYALAIPFSLIISPLMFPLLFITFQLLMLIPYFIICGSVGLVKRGLQKSADKKKKKKRPVYSWMIGLVLGAVQGVIMLALVLSPISGILTCTTEVVDRMESEAPDMPSTETISNSYDSWIKPWAESPVIKAVAGMGGKKLYHSIATVKIDGVKHDMFESLADPTIKVAITIHDLWGWDWAAPTEENEATIRALIEVLGNHDYATEPIVDVIKMFADAYKGGAIKIEIDGSLGQIIGEVFVSLDSIENSDDLKSYISTFADVYFLLAENDVLVSLRDGDEAAIIDALTATIEGNEASTTVVSAAVDLLNKNDHTRPLVTAITKLTLSSLITEVLPEGSEEIYENIKEGANDILAIEKIEGKEDEYVAEVSEKLDEILLGNGIEVEKEILDEMAGYISDNYDEGLKLSEIGEINDETINNIILSYYDAYINFLNQQNQAPEIPENPENPESPENPENPEIPETPENPEIPEEPGNEDEPPQVSEEPSETPEE